jgi:hypothetical protein
MSYTTTWGYDAASVVEGRKITPANLNFGTDFVKTSYKPGEAIISNLTSPLDRVETVRFAVSPVANIYAGTKLDPSNQSQNKRGTNVLIQVRSCLGVTDSDTNEKIILPFEGHLVLRVPQHDAVTTDIVKAHVSRVLGGLYEDGDTFMGSRLSALLRGGVLPSALA